MQYDIAAKRLVEIAKEELLLHFLKISAKSAEIIEIPQETVSVKRTDFALLVKDKSRKKFIVLLEFQTEWRQDKVLDFQENYIRFKRKYKMDILPVMLLFRKNTKADGHYKDHNSTFKFRIIKLWQLQASEFLHKGKHLLPLIPLMKSTRKDILMAEDLIYKGNLPESEKLDVLTIFNIFIGLKDKNLALEFLKRRKDIMIQSPIYDIILKEGIEQGIEQGIEKGIEQGIERGTLQGKLEAAFKMQEAGIPYEKIKQITGLTDSLLHTTGVKP